MQNLNDIHKTALLEFVPRQWSPAIIQSSVRQINWFTRTTTTNENGTWSLACVRAGCNLVHAVGLSKHLIRRVGSKLHAPTTSVFWLMLWSLLTVYDETTTPT